MSLSGFEGWGGVGGIEKGLQLEGSVREGGASFSVDGCMGKGDVRQGRKFEGEVSFYQ